MRRVYRTPRITVERRPSSPRASRALPCASRQPRPAPCRALKDGASCPCPLSAAPRASLPFTPVSPGRGDGRWTSKTLLLRTATGHRPLRGRPATEPLAELGLVPRRRVDPDAPDFRQPRQLCDPPLREEQIGGGPPCRQVGRLSWDSVPRRLGSEVRANERCWLIRLSAQTLSDLGDPTGASPRARRPVAGTPFSRLPMTCVIVLPGLRRGGHRLALSRARRAFARRGVLRVASFR